MRYTDNGLYHGTKQTPPMNNYHERTHILMYHGKKYIFSGCKGTILLKKQRIISFFTMRFYSHPLLMVTKGDNTFFLTMITYNQHLYHGKKIEQQIFSTMIQNQNQFIMVKSKTEAISRRPPLTLLINLVPYPCHLRTLHRIYS